MKVGDKLYCIKDLIGYDVGGSQITEDMEVGKYYRVVGTSSKTPIVIENHPMNAIIQCIKKSNVFYDVFTCRLIDDCGYMKKMCVWEICTSYNSVQEVPIKEVRAMKLNRLSDEKR